MVARTRPDEPLNGIYEKLGELVADVRTIKHSQNNASMKLDALGGVMKTVEALDKAKDDHEQRINSLEDAEQRRKGAVGLFEWFARHWPFTIIVAAIIAFWTWLTGRPLP